MVLTSGVFHSSTPSSTLVSGTFVSTLDIEMVQNTAESRDKGQGERRKSTLKAVIRHLPPSMTVSEFISSVDPLPDHNYFWFEEADTSLGQHAFSRAYINFKERDDIELFTDKFDGYVFVDSKGNEFPASVEFAPFQKIPKLRILASEAKPRVTTRDPKVGTIEEDPDYLAFLDSLKGSKTECNLPSAEIYLEEMEKKAKELKDNHGCPKVLTPLLEYVLNKKSESSRPIQEAKNPRRGRREEKGGKQKGQVTQERSKTGDSKLSRKDRRRERDRKDKRRERDPKEGEGSGVQKMIEKRRERDRKEGEGSGVQKMIEKPKESQSIKLLKNEGRNLVTNKPLTKDPSKLDKHTDPRTSIIEPIKVPTSDSLPPVKSVNNERQETELKKPITGKSHESSSPPFKARRDERKRNDRRDVKKDVNRDGKREEKRDEKKQDKDRKREGNRDVKKEGNIGEKKEDKTQEKRESKNVERKDESRKEEPGEVSKENVAMTKSSPGTSEGRKSSSDKRDRVRNKDRPDIPRYQPKVRSEPSHGDLDGEDRREPASSNQGSNRKVRTKVFTRTRKPEN